MSESQTVPFLWIGLDGLNAHENEIISTMRELDQVQGHFGFKVNLDFVLKHGALASRKKISNRPAFCDLKMWNGARTMASSFLLAHNAGFDVVNAHALAGGGKSKENGWELKSAIDEFRGAVGGETSLRIFAVTILTHYGDEYCDRIFAASETVVVRNLAQEGIAAGADGIIMPGTMLEHVADLDALFIIPGIRPNWFVDDRHTREVRPEEISGRTDIEAVCSSPIMKSKDPVNALQKILKALGQ